jgi:hypothetical protein
VVLALPAAAALAYGLGHLTWYLTTPLGRVPVLDERENLDLAAAIFGGSSPACGPRASRPPGSFPRPSPSGPSSTP